MPAVVVKYEAIVPRDRLRQGEILTGLVRVRQSLNSVGSQDVSVDEIVHPYLIVMTQDCDLVQDFDARETQAKAANDQSLLNDPEFKKKFDGAPKRMVENVLFCDANPTADMKNDVPQGKEFWKRIIQNNDQRYQCLEAVPIDQDLAGQGMPSLGCDFKRFVAIPTDEVYKRLQFNPAVRRARLLTPYAEHLLPAVLPFSISDSAPGKPQRPALTSDLPMLWEIPQSVRRSSKWWLS